MNTCPMSPEAARHEISRRLRAADDERRRRAVRSRSRFLRRVPRETMWR